MVNYLEGFILEGAIVWDYSVRKVWFSLLHPPTLTVVCAESELVCKALVKHIYYEVV